MENNACCATCLWCITDLMGTSRCSNPDLYHKDELAEMAYREIKDIWDDICFWHSSL